MPRMAQAASKPARAGGRATLGRARRRAPLVMLDPGHGGKDPGAIGVSGTYEKHVALATADGVEAPARGRRALSRGADPPARRVHPAGRPGRRTRRRTGAALFVSMHADALSDHDVRGASVYTLSNTASDAQTAALAQRENSADRFGGRGLARRLARGRAASWPAWCGRRRASGSARLARSLVGSLDQDLPMLPNPDRHAGFVVLKAADIPSVLVEMGFMSNPRDEAALRRPDHRRKVAAAMKRRGGRLFRRRRSRGKAGRLGRAEGKPLAERLFALAI